MLSSFTYVTRHEKIGLMCTKYTSSYYSTYIFHLLCKLYIFCKLLKSPLCAVLQLQLQIPKSGQILCTYKTYFLMQGHICNLPLFVYKFSGSLRWSSAIDCGNAATMYTMKVWSNHCHHTNFLYCLLYLCVVTN